MEKFNDRSFLACEDKNVASSVVARAVLSAIMVRVQHNSTASHCKVHRINLQIKQFGKYCKPKQQVHPEMRDTALVHKSTQSK